MVKDKNGTTLPKSEKEETPKTRARRDGLLLEKGTDLIHHLWEDQYDNQGGTASGTTWDDAGVIDLTYKDG